jgi:hypothetical protein
MEQPKITPVKCLERSLIHNQCYHLDKDYYSRFEHNGKRYQTRIPEGFTYDGASIPRPLWSILGATPDGLHRAATLTHDWLYIRNGVVDAWNISENRNVRLELTRKQADQIFLEQMLLSGVKPKRAKNMYRGVRIFGGLIRRF